MCIHHGLIHGILLDVNPNSKLKGRIPLAKKMGNHLRHYDCCKSRVDDNSKLQTPNSQLVIIDISVSEEEHLFLGYTLLTRS